MQVDVLDGRAALDMDGVEWDTLVRALGMLEPDRCARMTLRASAARMAPPAWPRWQFWRRRRSVPVDGRLTANDVAVIHAALLQHRTYLYPPELSLQQPAPTAPTTSQRVSDALADALERMR